jgi:F0F1-type ATP synthase assembly protein I
VQAAQKDLQQQGQVAGALQQEKSQEIQSGLQQRQQASKTRLRSITNQIGALSNNLKQDIFDKQTQFQKDELGRTYWNDRQLADWKIKEAKSDEELAEFEQNIAQEFEKKMAVLQASERSIRQRLEQEMQKSDQDQDQELKQRLENAVMELERKQQKAQARAAQNAMIMSAAGTVVGAGVGFVASGFNPAGAVVGASVGGGLGTAAAGSGKAKPV